MDSQFIYDEKLTTIKAFYTYLGEVLDKGYNNNYDTLMYIVKHINNYQNDIIEETSRNTMIEPAFIDNEANMFNYEYKLSSSSSSSSNNSNNNSNNTTEDEDESEREAERLYKEKELQKIKKFFDGPDLSKIYLYKKDNKFVRQMENFIKNAYKYNVESACKTTFS